MEGQLFVFLKVLIVCQRNSLHDGQHGHQGTIDTAGLSADQLRDIRILFLRHNAASGAVRIIHLNKTVLVAVPDDDLLGETAQMHGDRGECCQKLNEIIPVGYGIHAV